MADVAVAVLATLDSKGAEAQFVCDALTRAGVAPRLIDLSLRPHDTPGAEISGGALAEAATVLYDLHSDPEQRAPVSDAAVENQLVSALTALLRNSEAPRELYERFDLDDKR